MKFCPKCGSTMKPERKSGRVKFVCNSCGYVEEPAEQIVISSVSSRSQKEIVISNSNIDVSALPKTKVECPKCGNNEAYWWMIQTRSADEPPTTFYKCTKCGHTWRDYK